MKENHQNKKPNNSLPSFLNLIPDAVIIVDSKGFITATNQIVGKYTGTTPKDLLGNRFIDLPFLDDRQKKLLAENLKKRLDGNPISPYELEMKAKTGIVTSLELTGKKIEYEGEIFDLVVLHDVTERSQHQKQLQDDLFKSELKFKTIIDCAVDGIVLLDKQEKIRYWNAAAERIFGYQISEVLGKKLRETIVPAHAIRMLDKIKEEFLRPPALANRIHTVPGLRKDNVEIPTEMSISSISVGSEKLAVLIFRDITERKNARTSEEKFFGIAESVKDALILINEDTKITFWNKAAEKIFGYSSKEVIGRKIHDIVLSHSICREGKKHVKQSVEIFRETGMGYFTVGNVEVVGRRRDGSEFPAELAISPLKLGNRWNAVGLVKDISQRKIAEQKLMEAEQRYHTLFNQAPLGVLVVDPETASIIEFNDLVHNQLGYSREEFESKTVFDIEAKETPAETKARLKEMAQTGGQEFETLQKTKTGELKNILVITRPFRSAGKTYLHCIFHDVTESKNVEQSLIESEARYRQLIEVAQEGIWAIDNDFITTFVNPRMAQMLGYQESEMVGKSLLSFLDKSMVKRISEILTEYGQPNVKGQYDYAFPHKNGNFVDTTVNLSIIRDDQKRKIGTLAVVSDITQRKKAEKALKESEELSRAIVANAPIGIATTNSTYHFISANEAFCNILGYTEEELRKLTFEDISDPRDIETSKENIAALEKGEISGFTLQKRYVTKNGTAIVGKVVVNLLRNQKGKTTLFVIELEDITHRKQLEDNLRSSEEKFRAISTSAMDAIILSDDDDKVIYWNPAAEKTFGYLANQAIGKKLADLVVPLNARQSHSRFLGKPGKVSTARRQFGLSALKKDGTLFPIDLSVVPVKLNGQSCFLSVVRDITEWKAMEEALRREKELLEGVTASTNILLSLVDRDYRIIWGNKVAKQTPHGSNIEGKYCYEVFAKNPEENCQGCGVKKIFEENETIARRDYYRKTQDGKDCWAELISTPIKDKDGNVVAALELAIDITERKQLQNKLAEYSQRLEEIVQQRTEQLKMTQAELVKSERLAAIGELAGMVGHDLRNPLSGIKNSAYYMKKKGNQLSPTQAKVMLETIDKCVGYSNKIINDLLDYSREIRLTLEQASPKKLLDDSLSILGIPNNVKVRAKLQDTPALMVDQDRIKRVFINLLKNAFDAMPNGGKVTVKGRQLNDNLEISFTDTGLGISEEVLPKLFSPLFTTKAQGMGFGLAICKRIIEAHQGTIGVNTVKGQGTTFILTLPIEQKITGGGEKVWINYPESSLSTTMKR